MKTFMIRKEDVQRRWFELDATNQVLGKLAVKAANLLMGKESPIFTPGVDTGDFVVVTNASLVKVTGNKEEGKIYRTHSAWVGSMVEEPLRALRSRKPEKVIVLAVKRMLPKNNMGHHMLSRLKVYSGKEHPHVAQAPERLEVPNRGGWKVVERAPRKARAAKKNTKKKEPAGKRA